MSDLAPGVEETGAWFSNPPRNISHESSSREAVSFNKFDVIINAALFFERLATS